MKNCLKNKRFLNILILVLVAGLLSQNIAFSASDLEIKTLSFWEKQVWEPIKTVLKKIEWVIAKIWEKLSKIANTIQNIALSKISFFGPAKVSQEIIPEIKKQEQSQEKSLELNSDEKTTLIEAREIKENLNEKPLTLEEIQEILDDIAERVDILNAQIAQLAKEKGVKLIKEELEKEKETEEEIEEDTEQKEVVLCWPNSVNINTASKEELQKITGIGPVLAQRIIEARPFYSLSDLIKVNGIGPMTLQKIIAQGCAYVEEFYLAGGTPQEDEPKITLFYPKEIPVNKEIEVTLSGSNLKNTTYDVKISILKITDESEQKRTISQIFNEKDGVWASSSYNYLPSVFSGTSFSRNFKLKIKDDYRDFRGQADIVAKIRESGKTSIYTQFSGKINITDPEQTQEEPKLNQPPIPFFTFFPKYPFINEEILFDASSSTDPDGQIVSFAWDFLGEGNFVTTTQPTITYSYSTSTNFTVTLQVIDNQGATSSTSTTINVIEPILAQNIIISEVQIADEKTIHDFIELFNPTNLDIYLGDYNGGYFKLVKRTQTGTGNINIKSWRGDSNAKIPAFGYYLWASSEDKNYPSLINADASTTENISPNNGIGLILVKDDMESIIDAVGWGDFSNVLYETSPFPQNPDARKSLTRRKWQGFYVDNNNNLIDFEISNPTPKS